MKTILITGATGGIGMALSLEYAASGVRLLLLARQEQLLKRLSNDCIALGAEVHFFSEDLENTASVLALMKSIVSTYEIDVFISNAGITAGSENGQVEAWNSIQQLINVNLLGALAVAHPVLEDMQSRNSGHMVYISSLAAYYGMSITPAYSASKAGLKAYAEAMRVLLEQSSVSVTLVTPGFVETAMSDKFMGKKPFMISAEEAARRIKKGLDRHARVVTFPLTLSVGMRLLSCLPAFVADRILATLRY